MMYRWFTQLCRDHYTVIRLNDTNHVVKYQLPLQNHKDGFVGSFMGHNKTAQDYVRLTGKTNWLFDSCGHNHKDLFLQKQYVRRWWRDHIPNYLKRKMMGIVWYNYQPFYRPMEDSIERHPDSCPHFSILEPHQYGNGWFYKIFLVHVLWYQTVMIQDRP